MMNDDEITALAKGVAPFVRECVAENMIISGELAAQIASAARLLHESPPIEERAAPSRIIRVERDEAGNFVPVYDEPKV